MKRFFFYISTLATAVQEMALLFLAILLCSASSCERKQFDESKINYIDRLEMDRPQFDHYCDSVNISNNLRDWYAVRHEDYETKLKYITLLYVTGDTLCTQLYTTRLEIAEDTVFVLTKKENCK